MPFQTSVTVQPAPAVAGDFADANPRATVNAGPGGLVAGPGGLTVGRFAWLASNFLDADNAPTVANSFGFGPIAGFVHREEQAFITTYLAESSMVIPGGFGVTLMSAGGFWAKNDGAAQATIGQTAYADFATGAVSFASRTGAGATSTVAASTFSATGSVSGNQLTVTAVGSGTLVAGATISGTNVTSGSQIVSQISGAAGGIGVYALSIGEQTAASTTISGTYGTLTIGGSVTNTIAVGGLLSGSGVVAGTSITQALTGTGGAGTYAVNNNTVVASTAITVAANVATKFVAASSGNAAEIVKITTWLNG